MSAKSKKDFKWAVGLVALFFIGSWLIPAITDAAQRSSYTVDWSDVSSVTLDVDTCGSRYTGSYTVRTTGQVITCYDADSDGTGVWKDITPGTWQSKPWFDITHPKYGAIADDDSDDFAAIDAAINAASAAGGGTVYAPEGKYLTSSTIVLPNLVRLIGDGPRVTIIQVETGWTAADPVVKAGSSSAVYDARIENLTLLCDADTDGDCCTTGTDRANVGFYSEYGQQGSGARNVLIQCFEQNGILLEDTELANMDFRNVTLSAHWDADPSGVAAYKAKSEGPMAYSVKNANAVIRYHEFMDTDGPSECGGSDTEIDNTGSVGFLIAHDAGLYEALEVENYETGVQIGDTDTSGTYSVRGLTLNRLKVNAADANETRMDMAVKIENMASTDGVTLTSIYNSSGAGVTALIDDQKNGYTTPGGNVEPFYAVTDTGGNIKFRIAGDADFDNIVVGTGQAGDVTVGFDADSDGTLTFKPSLEELHWSGNYVSLGGAIGIGETTSDGNRSVVARLLSGNEYFRWDNAASWWEVTDDLDVEGNLTSDALFTPDAADCSGVTTMGSQCFDNDDLILYIGDGAGAPTAIGPGATSEDNNLETVMTGVLANEIVYGASGDTGAYAKISALTEELTPATGDWLLGEESGGNIRKFDIGDLPGGAPGEDSIGTDELDDGTDTPLSGEYIRVDTVDQEGIEYRTDAEVLADIGAEPASDYSGIGACAASNWASTLNDDASPTCTQPGFSDISGTATEDQLAADLAFDDGDSLDFSGVTLSSIGEGIIVPSLADCDPVTGVSPAVLCYDTTNDSLCVYDGSAMDCQVLGVSETGDVESVGDCTSGACYDGSSDGGTYVRLFDGNVSYNQIDADTDGFHFDQPITISGGTGAEIQGLGTEALDIDGNGQIITLTNGGSNGVDIDTDGNLDPIGTGTVSATDITVSDDEATADAHEVCFTTDNTNLESDGDFTYNPSTGTVAATEFSGGGSALTAVDAATGDSATGFFDAGLIEHEYGGLEADVSGYTDGLYGMASGVTADIDTESELETALGALDVVTVTADDITTANLMTCLSDEGAATTLLHGNGTWAQIVTGDIAADTITDDDVAAELDTVSKTFLFDFDTDGITTSDEFTYRVFPSATTVTRIECESYSGTSFTIQICKGEDRGDDTCTTAIATASLTCDADAGSACSSGCDTTIASGALTARQQVTIVVSAISGTVTQGEVYIEATID